MLVDPKSPKDHKKRCEKCDCPLYLLKTEKWKWESRRFCSRCTTPKKPSTTLLGAALGEATGNTKRYGLKNVLARLPKGGDLPESRKPPKLRNRVSGQTE